MTQLDQALSRLMEYPGVEHLLLLGQDGLLVRQLDRADLLDGETVAAMVPAVVSACGEFAREAGRGTFSTAVLDLTDAVAILTSLPPELLLTIILRPGVGFAPLLHELGRERTRLASLV